MNTHACAAVLVSVACVGFAGAGPTDQHRAPPPMTRGEPPGGGGVQGGDFFDSFENYAVGSDIVGQGGWEVWYLGGEHAEVSDDTAADGVNSLKHHVMSDIVQRFDIDEGQHTFSIMTYVPSGPGGAGYVVLLNQYGDPNTDNWSAQVRLDGDFDIVESQFDSHTTPLFKDQWVELRFDIDLDADRMNISYGGILFAPDLVWTENVSTGGITSIACLDLFSELADPIYFDATGLDGGGKMCRPDLDENGTLDVFDYFTFINIFNAGQMEADCDQDGGLGVPDFLCFIGEFDAGC